MKEEIVINRPLAFEELNRLNEDVLDCAEAIHKNAYKKFSITDEARNASSILQFTGYPLLVESENYYNGELLSAYAIYKALREKNKEYRVIAYYFENLIFRMISFWEYLYQFLNIYLQLNLFDDGVIRQLIEKSKYELEFVNTGEGTMVNYVELPREKQVIRQKNLKKQLTRINKYNIVTSIQVTYEVKENIQELLEIILKNNVEELKSIRNQIIHQRPAGATHSVIFDKIFNNYSVLIKNDGWVDFNKMDQEVEICIECIEQAIQKMHKIIYLNDFPNYIENAGNEYYLKKVQCLSCNKLFTLPSVFVGDNNKFSKVIICPNCGKSGCNILGEIKVTEIDYGSSISNYLEKIEDLYSND